MKVELISIESFVVVALERVRGPSEGSELILVTKNIVTYAGDQFYAQRAVKALKTNNFTDMAGVFNGIVELYNGTCHLPAKSNTRANLGGLVGGKPMEKNYPRLGDDNPRNKGAGKDVVSYFALFEENDGNGKDVTDVVITNKTPGDSEPLLLHARFEEKFSKTENDIMRVFLNHKMSGL